MTLENVTKAAQTADLLCRDLQAALRTADPVVALLLMPMISRAAALCNDANALSLAMTPE